LSVVIATIGSRVQLASLRLTRRQRHEIHLRLAPVEALTRKLLVIEAFLHLMMTPHGHQLRATAKPLPQPRWRDTQAPRLYAAEHVVRTERQQQPATSPGRFRTLRWKDMRFAGIDRDELAPAERRARSAAVSAMLKRVAADDLLPQAASARLARRIATLEHVLAHRETEIRRLAAWLARIPLIDLARPRADYRAAAAWWHGRPEYLNADTHLWKLHRAYAHAARGPP
jgi:hypothetical protein